ncbi:tetratricopeptide repeat protein [Planktomarina temperata]|nr:tetratricopeptide repeat protein [Planktomarina temperata]
MAELTIDQALQQGIEAHKAGQLQDADRLYTAILKAQPKHPDANHNMGVLAVGVGKVEQALPFFRAALEANPATAQFWLSYIDALIKLEQLADATAVLDQARNKGAKGDGFDALEQRLQETDQDPVEVSQVATEPTPKKPNILDSLKLDQAISLAKRKKKDGDLEDAMRIYHDILAKFPNNKRASDGIKGLEGSPVGKTSKVQDPTQDQLQTLLYLYSRGQLQQALKQATALLLQFPSSSVLYNICGAANKGLGQLDASVEAYNNALTIKPDFADAYNNMGVTLKEQGKLEKAIEAYNKALSIKPDHTDAHYNMGVALKEQGELEKAIEAFGKTLAIKPNNTDAHYNMGNVLKEQGKLEEAIEAYNKVLAIKPDYAEAHNNIGNTLKEQARLEEATEAYNKALTIKPDYADAYNNIGNTLQEQGKLDEAIEAYNKALTIKPDLADAYSNMGVALQKQGKLEEAIEAYNKVLAIKHACADTYYNMGVALKRQGKLEKAIAAYSNALAIKPDYAKARHMRSALTGEATNAAPREYIENLFDSYAARFENSLLGELEYSTPTALIDLVLKQSSNHSLGSVLDLGCGTGLVGEKVKRFCVNLEGVDLSNLMLEQARLKNIYDKLSHSDITEYLSQKELSFDYFISSDVFIYLGDLSNVFQLIKLKNKRSGKLVFSTEYTELEGFQLEKSGRYSHSKAYIEKLCAKYKYTVSHYSTTKLRKEKGQFIIGGLYVLDF